MFNKSLSVDTQLPTLNLTVAYFLLLNALRLEQGVADNDKVFFWGGGGGSFKRNKKKPNKVHCESYCMLTEKPVALVLYKWHTSTVWQETHAFPEWPLVVLTDL